MEIFHRRNDVGIDNSPYNEDAPVATVVCVMMRDTFALHNGRSKLIISTSPSLALAFLQDACLDGSAEVITTSIHS